MIVVADTSPINYLLLINQIDLLPCLFRFRISRRIIQALLNKTKD